MFDGTGGDRACRHKWLFIGGETEAQSGRTALWDRVSGSMATIFGQGHLVLCWHPDRQGVPLGSVALLLLN